MIFPAGRLAVLENNGMGVVFHLIILAGQITVAIALLHTVIKLMVSRWSQ